MQIYGLGQNAYGALRLDNCVQSGNVILEGYNNLCQIGSGFNSTPNGPNMITGVISDGGNNNGFVWMSGSTTAGCTVVLTAVNTCPRPTVVSNLTTMALSGSGSIATSSSINLNNGTLFDVSETSGTYVIPAGQTLANLNGSATIKGNLNLASGATLNLTNNVAGAPLIVTNGTLTLNNPTVNVSLNTALTPSAIGYLLIQGINGGTVAGSVASSTFTFNGGSPPAGTSLAIVGGSLYLVATEPIVMSGPNPVNPVIYANNATYTNTNSITFSVIVVGASPLTNQWYVNGAPVTGGTGTSVTLSNVAVGTYTITFGATNGYAPSASASTTLTVVPAPTTSFASNVLALNPLGYWRLNEPGVNGAGMVQITASYARNTSMATTAPIQIPCLGQSRL